MKRVRASCILALAFILSALPAAMAQQSIDGTWTGTAGVDPSQAVVLTVIFKTEEGQLKGWIDIPDLGISGLALSDVKFDGKKLSYGVPLPDGTVPCWAELGADGTFSGSFDMGGTVGSFTLRRIDKQP